MIYNSVVEQTSKILVDGQLESQDIKTLHRLLDDSHFYHKFEISFIDVEYISALILKDLYRIKDKATIMTNTKSLWYYLTKFKIKNSYNTHFRDMAIDGSAKDTETIISIETILENIFDVYGYDFRNYERKHLTRRLELFIQQNNFKSFKQFKQIILDDSALFKKLLRTFSINTTNFFRNPLVFRSIAEDVLPILKSYPYIRVWCAGCSRGYEPYSIAIMFKEAGLLEKLQIYATDFNETILNEARNGIFKKEIIDDFKQNYIQYGGKKSFESYFEVSKDFVEVKKELKDKILFFEHNLVTDGSINEFHLIFCRNVLIYFDNILQEKVFKTIDNSLLEDGFLVLGESEIDEDKYAYKIVGDKKNKIYHKEN